MDSDMVGQIIAIIILLMFSAFFSASETAFTSVNKIRMKHLAGEGDKRAALVLKLTDNYDKLLTTILIGNNIVNIAMTALATVLFIKLCRQYGATLATAVITIVVLVFGEISPKSLAKELAEKFAIKTVRVIKVFVVIMTPVNFLFTAWKRLLSRAFNLEKSRGITEDELITIVEEAETEGSIGNEQSELIQNAIEFNDLTAEEVMTPRVDMAAVDLEDCTEESVRELFIRTGFSRVPIYEDNMDKILGVLNQKDFHNYVAGSRNNLRDYVKPVVFIAKTIKIAVLLKMMQQMKTHMAIVVNEYGGTEGLVTMEDIVEELVGEIYDEYDADMSQDIISLPNGSYRVKGSAPIGKIFEHFGIDEDMDVNTVNGWVTLCLDRLPERGDSFKCRYENKIFRARVTKAESRRAEEINLIVEESTDDD